MNFANIVVRRPSINSENQSVEVTFDNVYILITGLAVFEIVENVGMEQAKRTCKWRWNTGNTAKQLIG